MGVGSWLGMARAACKNKCFTDLVCLREPVRDGELVTAKHICVD